MVKDVLFHDYKGKKKILELIYGEKKNFQNLPDSPLNNVPSGSKNSPDIMKLAPHTMIFQKIISYA